MNRQEDENGKTVQITSWQDLDASVTCLFDLYMARLDPFERYFSFISNAVCNENF